MSESLAGEKNFHFIKEIVSHRALGTYLLSFLVFISFLLPIETG